MSQLPSIAEEDAEFRVMSALLGDPEISQRELAAQLGVSLGRMNYCMRALVEKGWVKAHNFRRSDNKLAYAYVLTPRGIRQRATLTSNFLARKKREYDALGREIAALQLELAARDSRDDKRGSQ